MAVPKILENTPVFWSYSNLSCIYLVIGKQCTAKGHRSCSSKLTMCLLCDVHRQVRKQFWRSTHTSKWRNSRIFSAE